MFAHSFRFVYLFLLISYLFDNFKGYEIVALVHPDNEPSKKLLEKLNFESDGYVEKLDSIVYCLKSFRWLHGNKRKNNNDKF